MSWNSQSQKHEQHYIALIKARRIISASCPLWKLPFHPYPKTWEDTSSWDPNVVVWGDLREVISGPSTNIQIQGYTQGSYIKWQWLGLVIHQKSRHSWGRDRWIWICVSSRSALTAYCHSTPARATGDLVSKLIIKSVLDLTAHAYQLDSLVEDELGCGCVGIKCVVQEIIVQTGGSWCLMQALYYSLSWRWREQPQLFDITTMDLSY